MRSDPQVQVFPKFLQFCQDLPRRAEILQILGKFGQQVKVPSIPRGEDQLGNCWQMVWAPKGPHLHSLSLSPLLLGCLQDSNNFYLGDFLPSSM